MYEGTKTHYGQTYQENHEGLSHNNSLRFGVVCRELLRYVSANRRNSLSQYHFATRIANFGHWICAIGNPDGQLRKPCQNASLRLIADTSAIVQFGYYSMVSYFKYGTQSWRVMVASIRECIAISLFVDYPRIDSHNKGGARWIS